MSQRVFDDLADAKQSAKMQEYLDKGSNRIAVWRVTVALVDRTYYVVCDAPSEAVGALGREAGRELGITIEEVYRPEKRVIPTKPKKPK